MEEWSDGGLKGWRGGGLELVSVSTIYKANRWMDTCKNVSSIILSAHVPPHPQPNYYLSLELFVTKGNPAHASVIYQLIPQVTSAVQRPP